MDLRSLLSQFDEPQRRLRLAEASDNDRILDFFDRCPMEGKALQIRYDRRPDFFKFLKAQSDRFYVFIYENQGEIRGVATLSLRPAYIQGKEVMAGYLGDLRAQRDRWVSVVWRKCYQQLLNHASEIEELQGCIHFYTSVLDQNSSAQLSLIRHSRHDYLYTPLARYEMVNLLGKFPRFAPVSAGHRALQASENDAPRLLSFLEQSHRNRPFGFTRAEWRRRIETWPDFGWSNFFFVESENQEILACFALWSPSKHKRIIVEKVSWTTSFGLSLLKPFLFSPPQVGKPLEVLYLTHFTFADGLELKTRRRLTARLLHQVHRTYPHPILSFCNFRDDSLLPALRSWVAHRTPISLYQVSSKTSKVLDPIECPPWPDFEMALI